MSVRYWLFKSEPGSYSYGDLVRDGVAEWESADKTELCMNRRSVAFGSKYGTCSHNIGKLHPLSVFF